MLALLYPPDDDVKGYPTPLLVRTLRRLVRALSAAASFCCLSWDSARLRPRAFIVLALAVRRLVFAERCAKISQTLWVVIFSGL
jgi:hypothetical protein